MEEDVRIVIKWVAIWIVLGFFAIQCLGYANQKVTVPKEKEKLEEEIFLGFRKTEGVNVEKIREKFDVSFEKKYKSILDKYSGYIIKTDCGYAFNLKGTMLSNEILPEFLSDD